MSLRRIISKKCPGKMLPESKQDKAVQALWECGGISLRNKRIISLLWRDNLTLAEAGKRFGLTRERVRQIEERAAEMVIPHILPYLVDAPSSPPPVPLTMETLQKHLESLYEERDRIRKEFRLRIRGTDTLRFLRLYGKYTGKIFRGEIKGKEGYQLRQEAWEKYRASLGEEEKALLGQYARLSREIKYVRRAMEKVAQGETVYRIKIPRPRRQNN